MATPDGAGGTERRRGDQGGAAVAEMQPALGEGGLDRQQPGHGVAVSLRIGEPGAEHHVAAAFAIDRPTLPRCGPQPVEEAAVARQPAGLQLRVAAGQVEAVHVRQGLVMQGREERQLGAEPPQLVHRAMKSGGVALSVRELSVLEMLMARVGRVVTKRQIVNSLSAWDADFSENAVEVYVYRLRKRLEGTGASIQTVRGFGYMLDVETA